MTTTSPYIGLRPYTYEERNKFFGRDDDIHILLDKVMANRLTLLFAASGVGKSSLLAAGLIPQLREQVGYDVVYFRDWAADAETELKQAVVVALAASLPAGHVANWQPSLAAFLRRYSVFGADKLVVLFDRFLEVDKRFDHKVISPLIVVFFVVLMLGHIILYQLNFFYT